MKVSFCMLGFGYTQNVAEECIALVGQLGAELVQVEAHNWVGATAESWGKLTFLDSGDLDFASYLRRLIADL